MAARRVGTVVLDECHERHLDADLLLAMLLDLRAGLRPDLRLLATSATVAAHRLAALLGGDTPAPVLEVATRAFPVAVGYLPAVRGERLEATVARVVGVALDGGDGDVLVFLPGVGEIRLTDLESADLGRSVVISGRVLSQVSVISGGLAGLS